jgi:hypothetical protein
MHSAFPVTRGQAALVRLPDAAGELGRCFAAGVAAKQLRKEEKGLEGILGSELAVSTQVLQRMKLNKVSFWSSVHFVFISEAYPTLLKHLACRIASSHTRFS